MRAIITSSSAEVAQPAPVVAGQPPPLPSPMVPDGYLEKLVKLVPADVVTLYSALAAYVSDDPVVSKFAFCVGAAATILWTMRPTKMSDGRTIRAPFAQYPISLLAFVLWATVIAHPIDDWFGAWVHGHPKILGVVVAVFTLVAPAAIRDE